MNSIDKDNQRHLFVCNCGDVEHQFILSIIDNQYEDNPELFIHVHLSNTLTWYQRVWYSLLYILGKQSKYGAFGEVILDHHDIRYLIEVLSKYSKLHQE